MMHFLIYTLLLLALIHFRVKGIIICIILMASLEIYHYHIALIIVGIITILFFTPIRRFLISGFVLKLIKKLGVLPKISETEKIALDAGTTWIEGEFFKAKPDMKKILNEPYEGLSAEETSFLENEVEEVCNMATDWEISQNKDLPANVWKYLREKKFFGMIIPKKYGGLEFSAVGQSSVVGKLGTRSQVLSITTMVPNSLGPAELLLKYGTEKQKDYYLPRLADGRDIPCFGLTEPFAGSDAGSIKSEGVLFKAEDGTLKIRINFEKRYITLGGIATVIGLAFVLKDPENLISTLKTPNLKTGITCALLRGDLPGITRGRRHMPMYIPFINSPLHGKDVIISVEEEVIGGETGLGHGWQMLMDCLSVGRGVSLPAISTAAVKYSTKTILMYSSLRRQFGLPISKFESIEDIIASMLSRTYTIEAIRTFTATAVKHGHKPAVVNAIAKYHTTEMLRSVVNDGMDIMAGSAISTGPNNLLAQAYLGIPVGITVEGANIMTRSLLQFGQGLMRCHPFLYNEMISIQAGNVKDFDKNFFGHIGLFLTKRVRWFTLGIKGLLLGFTGIFYTPNLICRYSVKMERISTKFAFLADLILLIYGGDFKKKEKLSSRFADVLSSLYMMSCILRRFKIEGEQKDHQPIVIYSLENYLGIIDKNLTEIYANLSLKKWIGKIIKIFLLLPPPCPEGSVANDKLTYKIVKTTLADESFFKSMFSDVFVSKDKNDRFTMLHNAFKDNARGSEIIKKVRSLKISYEEAMKRGVLTSEEYEFISKWQELVDEIMQVDDFELKSNAFTS